MTFNRAALGLIAASVAGLYILALAGLSPAPRDGAAIQGAGPGETAISAPGPDADLAASPGSATGPAKGGPAKGGPATVTEATFVKSSANVLLVGSAGKLSALFKRIGYELDGVRIKGEVPRLFLASLPHDLVSLERPTLRKVMFIKSTLPLVLHVNELIMHDRDRLFYLREQVQNSVPLSYDDQHWLDRTAARYGLEDADFDELLRRVDVIPPSLAIAQAAEESGWGTSRFAREGNALFGQRIYDDEVPGLVPERRTEGVPFKVRAFNHLIDGVKAYMRNLNSHFAYDRFREMRAEMRAEGDTIDGAKLVGTLDRYSERGDAYIATIRTIMRANGLDKFDGVRLGEQIAADDQPPDA